MKSVKCLCPYLSPGIVFSHAEIIEYLIYAAVNRYSVAECWRIIQKLVAGYLYIIVVSGISIVRNPSVNFIVHSIVISDCQQLQLDKIRAVYDIRRSQYLFDLT